MQNKDVIGFETLYSVDESGAVFSKRINRHLKPTICKNGYKTLMLQDNKRKKTAYIHKLVAESFLGHIPCGYEKVVNHIDGNKLNNNLSNLEVITQRENVSNKNIKTTSKYTGVSWEKKSKIWVSYIGINGKNKYLGRSLCELKMAYYYNKKLKTI
jgi:hypothetical protein